MVRDSGQNTAHNLTGTSLRHIFNDMNVSRLGNGANFLDYGINDFLLESITGFIAGSE
jgi:hypothetical protein